MELILSQDTMSSLLEKAYQITSSLSISDLKEQIVQKICISCSGSCTGCEGTCHGSGCTGTHES